MTSNLNTPYLSNLDYVDYNKTWLSKIHSGCNYFAFIIGCFTCSILIFLTLKKTPQMFLIYSRLILASVLIDSVYLIINFMNQFRYKITASAFLSSTTGILKDMPYSWQCHGSSFSSIIQESSFLILPYIYFYRFKIIKNKTPPNLRQKFCYFSMCLLIIIVSYITTYLSFCPSENFNRESYAFLWYKENPTPRFLIGIYTNKSMIINSVLFYSLILICYSFTIVVALKTDREIKNFPLRFNLRTLSIHKQIDRALFLQALLPLSGILIPTLLYPISLLFNINIEYSGELTNFCVMFHPVFSSLSNLLFISIYRTNFLKPFKKMLGKSTHSPHTVVHISSIPMFVVKKNLHLRQVELP